MYVTNNVRPTIPKKKPADTKLKPPIYFPPSLLYSAKTVAASASNLGANFEETEKQSIKKNTEIFVIENKDELDFEEENEEQEENSRSKSAKLRIFEKNAQ